MVRVGGGWMALEEFLRKNDPCRGTRLSICFCIAVRVVTCPNCYILQLIFHCLNVRQSCDLIVVQFVCLFVERQEDIAVYLLSIHSF